MEQSDVNYGFDASVGEFTDLLKRGIIDPTKVVRTALIDSAGIASLMITTEAMVVEHKDDTGLGPDGKKAGVKPPRGMDAGEMF